MSLFVYPVLYPLLAACSGNPSDSVADSSSDADTDTDTDSDADTDVDTGPESYHGTVPDVSIPAPEFTAQNMDESPRTREDLIGHPSVIWFYPAAGTSG